eukprot:TRINITY_DN2361_c0_g1_i2.p1 TRINITY_DN2361_c0_g1~~TRINITY_DN2361_c0_g1_i2.p1  ORF type:complete len:407 (-),score=96.79 TRINITY_DN2361_c0_g1_i2:75-1295(-)
MRYLSFLCCFMQVLWYRKKGKGKGKLPPYVDDFHSHVKIFTAKIHSLYMPEGRLEIIVNRESIFQDSFEILYPMQTEDLVKDMFVVFDGEDGIDYGGMTREWFECLSEGLMSDNFDLLIRRNSYAFVTNPLVFQNPFYYDQFLFIGQLIGMAIYHEKIFELPFPLSFYKALLDEPVDINDIRSVDQDVYQSLKYIIDAEGEDLEDLGITFTLTEQIDGEQQLIELKPNGIDIFLDENNRSEYITLYIQYYLGIQQEVIIAVREGISKVFPFDYITFGPEELKEMINGAETIDLEDLKENVEYDGLNKKSDGVRYLWEVLEEFDQDLLSKFVQFTTGSKKVPVGGFAHLQGSSGDSKMFTIRASPNEGLPTAHSCFNRLELPSYGSVEETREKLLYAIHETEGFGIE